MRTSDNVDVLRRTVRRALNEARSGVVDDPRLNGRLYTLTAELHDTLKNHPDLSAEFKRLIRELAVFKNRLNA